VKHVYFLKPIGMAGPVKIGCSVQPTARLRSLDIWSPFPLELIASGPGTNREEGNLHWRFRDSRSHGEWFHATVELLNLIDHVRLNGTLPPLEAAPRGPERKKGGRNPNRDKSLSLAKSRFTRRISRAEVHAWGPWRNEKRPQWITDARASWQGIFTPYPSAELVEKIEAYIAELLSQPKEMRPWRVHWEERIAKQQRAAA
jgi:hypothetical protein